MMSPPPPTVSFQPTLISERLLEVAYKQHDGEQISTRINMAVIEIFALFEFAKYGLIFVGRVLFELPLRFSAKILTVGILEVNLFSNLVEMVQQLKLCGQYFIVIVPIALGILYPEIGIKACDSIGLSNVDDDLCIGEPEPDPDDEEVTFDNETKDPNDPEWQREGPTTPFRTPTVEVTRDNPSEEKKESEGKRGLSVNTKTSPTPKASGKKSKLRINTNAASIVSGAKTMPVRRALDFNKV